MLLLALVVVAAAYHPVVFMHGFAVSEHAGTAHDWDQIREWIQELHPGTPTFAVPLFQGFDSTRPLTEQLPALVSFLQNLTASFGSWIAVGHSQGGLLMRSVAETMPRGGMRRLVSLAGLQNGYYGVPLALEVLGKVLPLDVATDLFYSRVMQDELSVANFWRSPDFDFYAERNVFLPVVNNEHDADPTRKSNFLAVPEVHLFASPEDGLVVPWQSELFGQYVNSANDTRHPTDVIDMRQTDFYEQDLFGLRTLDVQGRLFLHTIGGVPHSHWLSNKTNFVANVLPLLD
jgi:palmitoyl-protein thioesterase